MKPVLAVRVFVYASVVVLTAAFAGAHGAASKPCYNAEETLAGRWIKAKTNAAVRGSVVGTEANQLYMMDPQRNHSGYEDVLGYRATLQDEEASTGELVTFSFVKYDTGGVKPLEGPSGVLHQATFTVFGFFPGQLSFDFLFTIGLPITIPETNHGVGALLPANASWPSDGVSVHGQLNLPNDPLRPRVPAPFDQQEWAFERPEGSAALQPLGGRKLDTLQLMTVWWTDPMVKTFVLSSAYGGSPEMLFGPESMHPSSARGDALGFYLQGGNDGEMGAAYFLLSTSLSPTPFQYAPASGNNWVYLGFGPGVPVLLMTGFPDPQHGRLTTQAIPFAWFPQAVRDFWVQVLLHYPTSGLVRITDAVGVHGI